MTKDPLAMGNTVENFKADMNPLAHGKKRFSTSWTLLPSANVWKTEQFS
jgi:hypothetical protein